LVTCIELAEFAQEPANAEAHIQVQVFCL